MAIIRRLLREPPALSFTREKQFPAPRQARQATYRRSIEKQDGHVGKRLKQGTKGTSMEIAHAVVAWIVSYGGCSISGGEGGRCQHST